MRSSSASWSTRSLKSSQDSSRLSYSSVESSGTSAAFRSSVTSLKWPFLLSTHCNHEPLSVPSADEARVQDLAARTQVDDQGLEAAVEQPVGRLARGGGVEVRGVPRRLRAERGGVVEPEPLDVALDARDRLVAVVDLAEQVLELLGPLGGLRGRVAEHGRCELEQVAQPLGRDPHVVQRLDVARVEHGRRERAQ